MSIYFMNGVRAYANVALESDVGSGSPHSLIQMLYEGALISIARARACMTNGDVAGKGAAMSRAVQIIEEGLKASLNVREGGELAQQLWQLYEYMCRRLLLASLRNETDGLDEVSGLLRELKDAWERIEPGKAPGAGLETRRTAAA